MKPKYIESHEMTWSVKRSLKINDVHMPKESDVGRMGESAWATVGHGHESNMHNF